MISPEFAQQRANGYLTSEVAMAFRPGEPILVNQEPLIWRMPVLLHLRYWGQVATLGSIDVDATTGVVLSLDPLQKSTSPARLKRCIVMGRFTEPCRGRYNRSIATYARSLLSPDPIATLQEKADAIASYLTKNET